MSTNANATAGEPAAKPARGKKLLVIGAVVALLLVVVAAAAAWFLSQRHALDDDGGEEPAKVAPAVVPTFLPMDTMVVNLSDAGGERFAQVGITLELSDAKTADLVKQFMPSIRSNILLLTSQRTSAELLTREGKEKLATDILHEVSRPLGFEEAPVPEAAPQEGDADDGAKPAKPAKRRQSQPENPVRRVHFSGFIIQ